MTQSKCLTKYFTGTATFLSFYRHTALYTHSLYAYITFFLSYRVLCLCNSLHVTQWVHLEAGLQPLTLLHVVAKCLACVSVWIHSLLVEDFSTYDRINRMMAVRFFPKQTNLVIKIQHLSDALQQKVELPLVLAQRDSLMMLKSM